MAMQIVFQHHDGIRRAGFQLAQRVLERTATDQAKAYAGSPARAIMVTPTSAPRPSALATFAAA